MILDKFFEGLFQESSKYIWDIFIGDMAYSYKFLLLIIRLVSICVLLGLLFRIL
jgi:ABC-type thiamin/hydroxymethylpyrimidine transport system permease subunit